MADRPCQQHSLDLRKAQPSAAVHWNINGRYTLASGDNAAWLGIFGFQKSGFKWSSISTRVRGDG